MFGVYKLGLLCALVNPRANQTDLLRRECFRWCSKAAATRPAGAARELSGLAIFSTAWSLAAGTALRKPSRTTGTTRAALSTRTSTTLPASTARATGKSTGAAEVWSRQSG